MLTLIDSFLHLFIHLSGVKSLPSGPAVFCTSLRFSKRILVEGPGTREAQNELVRAATALGDSPRRKSFCVTGLRLNALLLSQPRVGSSPRAKRTILRHFRPDPWLEIQL